MYKINIQSSSFILTVALLAIFAYSGSRFIAIGAEPEDTSQTQCCEEGCEHEEQHDDDSRAEHTGEEHEDHDDDSHAEHADEKHDGHDEDGNDEDEHLETSDIHDHTGDSANQDDHEEHTMGTQTESAQLGRLYSSIRLTGRIRLDQDNLAHIVPQTAGIVRQVQKTIGQPVKKDEILAWIESTELGQAKIKYLDIYAEIGCCSMLLSRSQNIHDNTLKLMELLKTNPSLEQLRSINGMEIGANRSKLITSYAQYKFSLSTYEREKNLFDQKITSKEEYLKAENSLQKAEAEYMALLDTVQFQIKQDLLENQRDQQMLDISLKGAQRTLMLLGLGQQDIDELTISGQQVTDSPKAPCTDPNCQECKNKQLAESKKLDHSMEKLGWYPLRAPFDGTIIDKHITLGERLGQESQAFTIADLDSVWIDLDVYQKDIHLVKTGQKVFIDAGNGLLTEGIIGFISPLLDQKTRTATGRVISDNSGRQFRPGTFVTANIENNTGKSAIILPKQAIQTVEGKKCVFVKHGTHYDPVSITIGRSNQHQVEVLSGVKEGQDIVIKGAFDLKANIITSTLDDHAGHGH